MNFQRLILFFSILCCLNLTVRAKGGNDIFQQKSELHKIKNEVSKSKKKLDSLKNTEIKIQKRISEIDQKLATNKKIIRRLNKKMKLLKKDINNTEQNLQAQQQKLDLTRRRYLGNIRQFYFATHKTPYMFTNDPNEELKLNTQIVYLTALANFESGNIHQTIKYLKKTIKKKDELSGESKKISHLKQKKETSTVLVKTQKKRQEKKLKKVIRKKTEEADRVLTLEQAAREMEQIIARLQKEAKQRKQSKKNVTSGQSVFATLKGQLLAPCRGRIIVPFGYSVDPVTNLKSFSSGVTIKGKARRQVKAVAAGAVAYVGDLRGYGKFVIINHDDQFFTTYAGLGKILVSPNEYVLAGYKLAVADKSGLVRFELRKGGKPLDPVKWIRIDSF